MTVSCSSSTGGLGNRALLDKMDKLRELGIEGVPLPQMVVVGDQSAGKSSVLESLTGFHFPRNVSLCTRHATEIVCRREDTESIVVSIQPADSNDKRAKAFRHTSSNLDGPEFANIFAKAADVMGIKADADSPGSAFSRDILRVEISGPNEDHLTVIDVPGMFENETPGVTTKDDIDLVKDMVKKYIHESRTIILAVVPCNGDIANQKILTYAKEADPEGNRTLGVLTKPDLAVENATKDVVVDLVQGKRKDLSLGYCVVKNRGADDVSSSHEKRDRDEKEFFSKPPWTRLDTERLGIPSLKKRIQQLLMDRTRSEFPTVRKELIDQLKLKELLLDGMGESRSNTEQQRNYLGKVAANFSQIKDQGLDAYYNRNRIFTENPDLKLITRIREINERFSHVLYEKGHTRAFMDQESGAEAEIKQEGSTTYDTDYGDFEFFVRDDLYDRQATFNIPVIADSELDAILSDAYGCAAPSDDDILDHIQNEYMTSRGTELGTFSGEMLPTTFKEQSKKWSPMARAHISNAILIVHHFIHSVLEHCCTDEDVRSELWNFLSDDLHKRYKHAIDHTEFLLEVEFQGTSMTYNPTFFGSRDSSKFARNQKLREEAEEELGDEEGIGASKLWKIIDILTGNDDPVKVTRQDIHDVLRSYYDIARSRFVDVICLQVIHHFLLHATDSPLKVFSQNAVMNMTDAQLDNIAGEDMVSRERRKKLNGDIENLRQALKILRA